MKNEWDVEVLKRLLSDRDRELFEDILANTISKKIRGKIQSRQALGGKDEYTDGIHADIKWIKAESQMEK